MEVNLLGLASTRGPPTEPNRTQVSSTALVVSQTRPDPLTEVTRTIGAQLRGGGEPSTQLGPLTEPTRQFLGLVPATG